MAKLMGILSKILVVSFLTASAFLSASAKENLPKLPEEPVLTKGTLPNGISYYLVANPSVKGVADIAVLQRACQNEVEVPSGLLVRHGIGPGKSGYVRKFEGNILYTFSDCPIIEGDTCVDSLLFASLNIIGTAASQGTPAYGTTNQTLIIAGDIDRNALATKLKMLSMGIPLQTGVKPQSNYSWNAGGNKTVDVVEGDGPTSTIEYVFRMPAMPREDNGTAVTAMSEQLNSVFETLLLKSIDRIMQINSVTVHDLSFDVLRSDAHEGDDMYTLAITVDKKDLAKTVRSVAQVYNQLVISGASTGQYKWAHNTVAAKAWVNALKPVSNEEYVTRCVNSILYNAGFASAKTKVELYRNKDIADSVRTRTFNRYAQGLITETETAVRVTGAPEGFTVADFVSLAREEGLRASLLDVNYADTLNFPALQKKKVKAPKAVADPMTGGNLWTYQNGLTMIYKKMQTDGVLYYSWVLRGGELEAPSLTGAPVGVLAGEDFVALLAANGIDMDIKATASDIRIEGTAEETRIQLLFKAFQYLFENRPELGSPMGGQLMLIGDRSDYLIQRSLQNLVLGFDGLKPQRQRKIVDNPWTLDKSDSSVVYQALISGDELYTGDNFMKARVAAKLLDEALVTALDGTGYYAEVTTGFSLAPRDILNVRIEVREVENMEQTVAPYRVKTLVKNAIAGMAAKPYANARVAVARKLAAGEIEKAQKTPEYWLEMARHRFSESKDFVSKYNDKINKVTPDAVRDLFKKLYANGVLEYTTEQ